VPVIADHQLWPNNPEKVIGITEAFVAENPNTTQAIVGADEGVIAASMTGTFEYEPGDICDVPA
jgi:nitrate/nitrite transport system substrate-binding protein